MGCKCTKATPIKSTTHVSHISNHDTSSMSISISEKSTTSHLLETDLQSGVMEGSKSFLGTSSSTHPSEFQQTQNVTPEGEMTKEDRHQNRPRCNHCLPPSAPDSPNSPPSSSQPSNSHESPQPIFNSDFRNSGTNKRSRNGYRRKSAEPFQLAPSSSSLKRPTVTSTHNAHQTDETTRNQTDVADIPICEGCIATSQINESMQPTNNNESYLQGNFRPLDNDFPSSFPKSHDSPDASNCSNLFPFSAKSLFTSGSHNNATTPQGFQSPNKYKGPGSVLVDIERTDPNRAASGEFISVNSTAVDNLSTHQIVGLVEVRI